MNNAPVQPTMTQGFFVQAVVSFGISFGSVLIGVAYLPVDNWIRAFLGIAMLFAIASTFTLAKVVRDRQEMSAVTNRVDQARLDKLISEHDPLKVA